MHIVLVVKQSPQFQGALGIGDDLGILVAQIFQTTSLLNLNYHYMPVNHDTCGVIVATTRSYNSCGYNATTLSNYPANQIHDGYAHVEQRGAVPVVTKPFNQYTRDDAKRILNLPMGVDVINFAVFEMKAGLYNLNL